MVVLRTHLFMNSKAVAAAASVITRKEIKTFGWRTLAEALNSLPGVHLTYDRQYTNIGSRGFSLPADFNSRLLILINGNRLNDAAYDSATLGREFPLDIDLIERIEFIPGPGGAVYGRNAIFGVVNVVTRSGLDVDGVELAGAFQDPQSLWQGRATWGKVLDNGTDVLLFVSGLDADGEDRFYVFPGAGPDGADLSGVASGLDGERDRDGETADTLELVADYRVAPDLNLRASVYQWTIHELITWNQDALQFQEGDQVEARGVELSLDKTWQWGGRLRGSVSYQDLAFANGTELPNAPRWLGKLNFSSPLPFASLRLGYELQYNSKRQAVDGADLDSYWLSNLHLMADGWAKGLEVSLGVYNLFDADYQQPLPDGQWTNALGQDGRSVRLKLDYRF